MGKLLGVEKDAHRTLYFAIFCEVVRGMSIAAAGRKYGRTSTIIRQTLYRMIYTLTTEILNDTDFPIKRKIGAWPTVRELQENPEYWITELYRHQDKVACTAPDQANRHEGKPVSDLKLKKSE